MILGDKTVKCECGNDLRIEKRSFTQDIEQELDNLYFLNLTVEVCDKCGNEIKHYYKINQIYRTIAQAIVLQTWLLRPQDIKFLRTERAIKINDWASILAIEPDTLLDWESGKQVLSAQADMAIRLLYCRVFEEQEELLFPQHITSNLISKNINQNTLAICIDMENPTRFFYRTFSGLKLAS